MEEDVLNALQTRTAYLPGGLDRSGKVIFVVNIINDLQLWNRNCLEISIDYLKKSLSPELLKNGVSVIVDAQKCSSRITRAHQRVIYALFSDTAAVNLYLVRSEGFWEKHVEPCTKSQTKDEPLVLSQSRLIKYFESHALPLELGGSLQFNYDLWLQQRQAIDEFRKAYEQTLNALDNLHKLLLGSRSMRRSESDQELRRCSQLHAGAQRQIEGVIERGNSILLELMESYPLPSRPHADEYAAIVATNASTAEAAAADAAFLRTPVTAPTTATSSPTTGPPTTVTVTRPDSNQAISNKQQQQQQQRLPVDLCCERSRLELQLNEIERRQSSIRTAWLELLQCMQDARELASLEDGVAFVTNWILSTAEQLLSRQQAIGCDIRTCEELRCTHDALEMECRETYGFYAELLYKIEKFSGPKEGFMYKDLLSQRDFMQFVCRSFATRLERRRNVLITSLRFYRLVGEYFDRTGGVFETLVMGNKMEDFEAAAENLQRLKDSQTSLAKLESEVTREGEKLSDMLAMPVKDALGRDLHFDYSDDIASIRDILETTAARCSIFSDSVELQKLTLEQVTHIHAYEKDARMAEQWLDDLYDVMMRCHSHVGCNIHEIQVQKDEVQSFQETGKSIYHYGSQLLQASQALRRSCRLDLEEPQLLLLKLERTWHSLRAISQEHMTRLRVSAVFHRSVEEYANKLHDLKATVLSITQSGGSSSSGVSSENDESCHSSSPTATTIRLDDDNGAGELCAPEGQGRQRQRQRGRQRRSRRHQLRKCLEEREELLVEVGRMVRLGRLLKTRLKEPFTLDVATGKSAMSDDLNHKVTSPSVDSGDNTTAATASTKDTSLTSATATATATTLTITPTGNNLFACNAITHKLAEITEVAEALDTAIHDAQASMATIESDSISPQATKSTKPSNSNNTTIEDWHSRSTEDDSFITASEGNFTPHSHSSSYQTASAHTPSFLGSDKNTDDAGSEVEDNTLNAFEMPESFLLQPPPTAAHHVYVNESNDNLAPPYLSVKQTQSSSSSSFSALATPTTEKIAPNCRIVPIDMEKEEVAKEVRRPPSNAADDSNKAAGNNSYDIVSIVDDSVTVDVDVDVDAVAHADNSTDTDTDDHSSAGDIEELHSDSDPAHRALDYAGSCDSVPIVVCEPDNEYASCIADAPSMEILTEVMPMPTSVTPEVSGACANANASAQNTNTNNSNSNNSNNNNKPNAAWRRNKYYENVTKQTIKGLL